jgi:hypothetical protein
MFNIPTQRLAKVTLTESTDSDVTLSVNPIVIAALSFTPRHLVVRVNAKTAYTGGDRDNVQLQFNGDYASNYNVQYLAGVGSSYNAGRISAATTYLMGQTAADDAYWFAGGECLIPDALSTRTHKSIISLTGSNEDIVQAVAGRWASTAAIVNVTFTCYQSPNQWLAGSTFELCVVDESFNIDQDGDGEQILGSNGAFTVSSISAADGDLVCIGNIRSTRASTVDTGAFEFNSDTTGTNYNYQKLSGSSTTVSAASVNGNRVIECSAANNTTSAFSPFLVQVINFSDGSNDRVLNSLAGHHGDSSSSRVGLFTQRWNNTAAVTAVHLDADNGDWLTGSMLSTYAVPKNLIERQEITGSTSDPTVVTFSDVPQTYDHLELSIYARTDRDSQPLDYVYMEFNDDTTSANYPRQVLRGAATTVSAFQQDLDAVLTITGNTGTANAFGSGAVTIYNYTKTDRHTHRLSAGGHDVIFDLISSRWENTAAVTKIHLHNAAADDFQVGSVFTLRGINSTVAAATSDVAALNGIAPADIEAVN